MAENKDCPKEKPAEEPLLANDDVSSNCPETRIQLITNSQTYSKQTEIFRSSIKKRPTTSVDVQWQNVSYSVSVGWNKERKKILFDHSGKARAGEMTAIIGPPGSGKTTLLKILAGYIFRNVSGSVALNGKIQKRKIHRIHTRYIMQHAEVHPQLTVLEVIQVAATLKIHPKLTIVKSEAISEVINVLGLAGCQKQKTKNITEGDRKRLAIAQELVNNPPVLFIDEPTSDLDSNASVQLLRLLRELCDEGHTIVCTIHHPTASMLALFDKMYVMSDGECVYNDSCSALTPFLESQNLHCPQHHNPADYMLEVITGLHGNYVESFKSIIKSTKVANGHLQFAEEVQHQNIRDSLLDDLDLGRFKLRHFAVNPWIQFCVLLMRNYKSLIRNTFMTYVRLVMHVAVALVTGLLYWKIGDDASLVTKNTAFLFFSLLFLIFNSIMSTVLSFPSEMHIFLKEQVNNWYSAVIYYVAKIATDVPFQIALATVYISIVYWMTGQPPELYRFGVFLLLGILTSLVAQSLGLVVGAAAKTNAAIFLAPVICVPIVVFSDYFLQLEAVPSYLKWIAYISYFRYAFEGTLHAIYGYGRPELHCPELEYCPLSDPNAFLQMMGVRSTNVWYDVLALLCFLFVVQAMGYGVLKWKIYFRK